MKATKKCPVCRVVPTHEPEGDETNGRFVMRCKNCCAFAVAGPTADDTVVEWDGAAARARFDLVKEAAYEINKGVDFSADVSWDEVVSMADGLLDEVATRL